jgi:hypothetical protein
MSNGRQIGQDLLNVPMGDMIRQMALSIAEAQLALDESGIRQAELMSGQVVLRDEAGNLIDTEGKSSRVPVYGDTQVFFGYSRKTERVDGADVVTMTPERVSMMELGFTPTFYQFIDTVIEVKIAITMTEETQESRTNKGDSRTSCWTFGRNGRSYQTTVTPVDATYASKYSYSAEGSSLLRTKLVPVPPPTILQERARVLMEQNAADRETARSSSGTGK